MPNSDRPVAVVPPPVDEGEQRQAAARAVARRVSVGRPSSYEEDPAAARPLGMLKMQYANLAYQLPWEILDYVEMLVKFNPDWSQAADNIRTLANSGHELYIDADSEATALEVKEMLEEKARIIDERSGGVDGLIDKLLHQAATFGAMCGEWVLNESLDDVVDFAELTPKNVRFFWDEEANAWLPFQKVSMFHAEEARKKGQEVRAMSYVALNPNTFFYYAFDSAPGSPYGVPPFVAAIQNTAIQNDMVVNMSQIVKKVGLLGIIDFVVKALPMVPGESDDEYSSRANAYLDDYVAAIQNMVKDGGIVHYDDSEAKTYQVTGNAAGATAIFKQNEELVFSGLRSMPSVQGRSYSTTETYAGVAYDIIIRNTMRYQRACKRMIERGYWLMVMAWGYETRVTKISLVFNSNKTLHRLQDAQAELMEIKNSLMLWAAGIIDQMDMAQRHGYDSVKTQYDEPPKTQIIGNGGSPGGGAGPSSTGGTEGPEEGEEGREEPVQEMPAWLRERLVQFGLKMRRIMNDAGGELELKVPAEKRRAQGRKLAEEVIALQDAHYEAGLPNIDKLQDALMKALDLPNP